MIRHILLLHPRADATAQEIESCRTGVVALVGRIPGVLNCSWGENLAAPERHQGFTYGFSMDFTDLGALHAYIPHPLHQSVATRVRATFEQILVLDIPLDTP
jgi:hypothetical protein